METIPTILSLIAMVLLLTGCLGTSTGTLTFPQRTACMARVPVYRRST